MSIFHNIEKVKDAMAEQNDPTGQFASQLQEQALEAILGGIQSPAWEKYMKNFVDVGNKRQLERLTGADDTANDPYMRRARAYLVSNALCGAITRTGLTSQLDDGLLDNGLA